VVGVVGVVGVVISSTGEVGVGIGVEGADAAISGVVEEGALTGVERGVDVVEAARVEIVGAVDGAGG